MDRQEDVENDGGTEGWMEERNKREKEICCMQ